MATLPIGHDAPRRVFSHGRLRAEPIPGDRRQGTDQTGVVRIGPHLLGFRFDGSAELFVALELGAEQSLTRNTIALPAAMIRRHLCISDTLIMSSSQPLLDARPGRRDLRLGSLIGSGQDCRRGVLRSSDQRRSGWLQRVEHVGLTSHDGITTRSGLSACGKSS